VPLNISVGEELCSEREEPPDSSLPTSPCTKDDDGNQMAPEEPPDSPLLPYPRTTDADGNKMAAEEPADSFDYDF